jgi:hypothetical protein
MITMPDSFNITPVNGHYDVYINGIFYCSADTMPEAIREVEDYEKNKGVENGNKCVKN